MRIIILLFWILALMAYPFVSNAQPPQWQQYIRYEKITQSYSVTAKQLQATQRFFSRIVNTSYDGGVQYYRVWDSIYALYPMISSTSAAQGVNAKTLGSNNYTYTGSPTVSDGFFTPAAGKYCATGIAINSLPQNSRHMGGVWSTAGTGNNIDCGNNRGTAPFEYIGARFGGNVLAILNGSGGAGTIPNSTTAATCYLLVRPTSDSVIFYKAGTNIFGGAGLTSATPDASTIDVGRGVSGFNSVNPCYYFTYGRLMRSDAAAGYSTAIANFVNEK